MRRRFLLGLYRITRHYSWFVLIIFLSLAIASLWFLQSLTIDSSLVRLLPKDDPVVNKIIEKQKELETTEDISILLVLEDPPAVESDRIEMLRVAGERVATSLQDNPEINQIELNRQTTFEPPIDLFYLDDFENEIDLVQSQIYEVQQTIEENQGKDSTPSIINTDDDPNCIEIGEIATEYCLAANQLNTLLSGVVIFSPQALQQLTSGFGQIASNNEEFIQFLHEEPRRLNELQQGVEEIDGWIETLLAENEGLNLQNSGKHEELNLSRDNTALVVTLRPRLSSQLGTTYNRGVVESVRATLNEIDFESMGVKVEGLVGPYAFSVESDDKLRSDTSRTAIVTIVGVLLLFIIVLRRFSYPLLATFPVLIALIFTIASAKLIFGGLNLVTAFLPAIILGLGIDYGIQFMVHYLEARQGSRRIGPALRNTLVSKGSAMLSAAFATTLVMFALGFIANTVGLAEIGYILGIGVLLSCFLTLILLPAIIFAASTVLRRRLSSHPPKPWNLKPLAAGVIKMKWVILGLTVVGSIFMILPASKIDFSFVSESLQPRNLESTRIGQYIAANFDERPNRGNTFAFFVPDDPSSREIAEQLQAIEGVDGVISLYNWVSDPNDIPRTISILERLRDLTRILISSFELMIPQLQAFDDQFSEKDQIVSQLARVINELEKGEEQASLFNSSELISERFLTLKSSTQNIIDRIGALDAANLDGQIEDVILELRNTIPLLANLESQIPTAGDFEDIEQEISDRLYTTDSRTGELQQIFYVEVNIDWLWDSDLYSQLLREFNAISTDFIGLAMIRVQLEGYMKEDFWRSTLMAIFIITLILFFDFRKIRVRGATLFSLIALGLGYLWLLGAMNFRGIDFNVANILISPLLLGLGVDNCVYLLHRYHDIKMNEKDPESVTRSQLAEKALSSTSVPILANTFATMIAFGSLILAETPILRFLGESAVWGIGFMTLFSLTFLPSVISLRR